MMAASSTSGPDVCLIAGDRMTPVRAFVVFPAAEGPLSGAHVYRTETPREAVLAHGKPGSWAVLEVPVFEAWFSAEPAEAWFSAEPPAGEVSV